MSLSVLIGDFLEHLEFKRHVSQLTLRNYGHYLKRFRKFAGEVNPRDIDADLIKRYQLYLAGWIDPRSQKPLKDITQNFFLIALRVFLKYLAETKKEQLLVPDIKLKKSGAKIFKIPGSADLQLLREAPDTAKKDGLRDRAILETLFSTGLRVAELVSLNRNIDLAEKGFEIIGKGARKRMVLLSDEACRWLKKYLAARTDTFKPLFIRFQGKTDLNNNGEAMRLTARSIERIVERYVKKTGISFKATPQMLRHSYTAELINNGTDIRSVKERLGILSGCPLQVSAGRSQPLD